MTGVKNPSQWPSFGHVGVWLAERSRQQVAHLTALAIFLQKWWRQHTLSRKRQKLYPIVIEKRAYNIRDSVERINSLRRTGDPNLSNETCAYEKLDGTNLGVRCDGAIFGRRLQVFEDSYQRVSLVGAIPAVSSIEGVKSSILETVSQHTSDTDQNPKLVIYGELMCNDRYDYDRRGMFGQFYSFGAVLNCSSCWSDDRVDAVADELIQNGFIATIGESGKLRLRMNEKLSAIIRVEGIECAPLLSSGRALFANYA